MSGLAADVPVYPCPDCSDFYLTRELLLAHLVGYHNLATHHGKLLAAQAPKKLPHELEVTCLYCQLGYPRGEYARHLADVHQEIEAEAHRLAEEAGRV